MRKLILLLIMLFPVSAAGQSGNGDGIFAGGQVAEIPFELQSGVPVVEVTIDGNDYRFILDTGAGRTFIGRSPASRLKLRRGRSISVGDVNNTRRIYRQARLKNARTGDFNLGKMDAVYSDDENTVFECMGIDGILSTAFFARYVVEIDRNAEVIRLYEPIKGGDDGATNWRPMRHEAGTRPYLFFSFGQTPENELAETALFDTGNGNHAMTVERLGDLVGGGLLSRIEYGYGHSSWGINGFGGQRDLVRAELSAIRLGGWVIRSIEARDGFENNIGMHITHWGRIVLDFPGSRYAFLPDPIAIVPVAPRYPVTTGVVDSRLVVLNVWDEALGDVIRPGYEIVKVGDKDITDVDRCGMPQLPALLLYYATEGNYTVTFQTPGGELLVIPGEILLG